MLALLGGKPCPMGGRLILIPPGDAMGGLNRLMLALKLLEAWHAETTKPCKLDYQFAELTPDGIFLVTKPNAGPYERRWHA